MLGIPLVQRSDMPDHNIFIPNRGMLYETLNQDRSFPTNPIFFVLSKTRIIQLHLGEYTIKRGELAFDFIKKMIIGDTVTRKITIPEGYTVKMIIEKLESDDNLTGTIDNVPPEGSLFPSTYFYKKGHSRKSLINKMQKQMDVVVQKLFTNADPQFVQDTIKLASIIEKESSIDEERPIIASVYKNRIKKNMKLESCPTVIYALSDGYGKIDHSLTRNDLKFSSPYNTYVTKGLPPTPICCPSEKSILSALYPATTDFFYFVADKNSKHHIFSTNYQDHLKNKNKKLLHTF